MREIVLPSGRFATLRQLTWLDRIKTYNIPDFEERVFALACRSVLVDGEPMTQAVAEQMDLSDAQPIIEAICKDMLAGVNSKGVA